MRALVTGGAGFIGSSVADRLLAGGWEVTAFDSFDPYYDPEQKRRNVAVAGQNDHYRLVEGDVRDRAAVDTVFAATDPQVVVHLAARAGVRRSVEQPASYVTTNELGGLHVIDACRMHGNVPIVFASTSSVYGDAQPPFREADAAEVPLSPYAASKRASELMVRTYHHLHGLPAAILRFFTVYGPRGRPDMAFWGFTKALRYEEPLRLHGETTARDFTHIDDIVDGVVGAIEWVRSSRGCDTFNLGRSEPVRVRRLIEMLATALEVRPRIEMGHLQPGESHVTAADVSRARAAFGYAPTRSLAEGIAGWVRWVDESPEAPEVLRRRGP
jgi:UDP-glucuronate 4-epimerase